MNTEVRGDIARVRQVMVSAAALLTICAAATDAVACDLDDQVVFEPVTTSTSTQETVSLSAATDADAYAADPVTIDTSTRDIPGTTTDVDIPGTDTVDIPTATVPDVPDDTVDAPQVPEPLE